MVAETDKLSALARPSDGQVEDKLQRLRTSYADALAAPILKTRTRTEKLLLFEVGAAAFGIRLTDIAQALALENLVAVPCAPPHVAGAVAYQQEVIGVLDLRSLLGLPAGGATPDGAPRWALVLRPLSRQWALAADAMLSVRAIDATKLQLASSGGESATIVRGSVLIDGRSVATLDVEALAAFATQDVWPEHSGRRPEGVEYA